MEHLLLTAVALGCIASASAYARSPQQVVGVKAGSCQEALNNTGFDCQLVFQTSYDDGYCSLAFVNKTDPHSPLMSFLGPQPTAFNGHTFHQTVEMVSLVVQNNGQTQRQSFPAQEGVCQFTPQTQAYECVAKTAKGVFHGVFVGDGSAPINVLGTSTRQ